MKIIAHAITNPKDAQKALNSGVDFIEIDVSQRIIFSKFTTQHHGVLGKFGFGENLEPILQAVPHHKLFLDLKHTSLSLNFVNKLLEVLQKYQIKKAIICGHEWQLVSKISQKSNLRAFYTVEKEKDLQRLRKILPKLANPAGFSVRQSLIDQRFMNWTRNLSTSWQVWAWTVDEIREVKRLKKLGVDGIITDNWNQLPTANNKL